MEEVSLKYVKMFLVFAVLFSISAILIKNHIESITKSKQTAKIIENMAQTQPPLAEIPQEITPQMQQETPIIEEVQPTEESSNVHELTPEEKAAIEASMARVDIKEENGIRAIEKGDIDSAIEYFKSAINEGDEKTKISSSLRLAECYQKKGDIENEINTYNRILPLISNPYQKRDAVEKLAKCYLQIGNKEQALYLYEQSYKDTQMAPDLANMGEIWMQMGEKEKLRGYLNEHLSRNPQDAQILQKYSDWANSN